MFNHATQFFDLYKNIEYVYFIVWENHNVDNMINFVSLQVKKYRLIDKILYSFIFIFIIFLFCKQLIPSYFYIERWTFKGMCEAKRDEK